MMLGAWWILVLCWPALLRGHPCLNCESYVAENLIPDPVQMSEDKSGGSEGEACGVKSPCGTGLQCHYSAALDTIGTCKEIKGVPCTVFNETYENGETFQLDCRTQCTCQEGRYACASLCPKEGISPLGSSCRHPRLVEVPGHCCREWMCDSHTAERPPECVYSPWSGCSSECGTGLSRRSARGCGEETRLCQHRPCPGPLIASPSPPRHRLRKGHECKATLRQGLSLRLLFASCLSRRRYRPKMCGSCPNHSCRPELSTSLRVPVLCRQPGDSLEDSTLGGDLWADREITPAYSHPMVVSVEWVSKCECTSNGVTTRTPELLLHRVHRTAAP